MASQLDHFTTWDDPRLWQQITDLVTSPQKRLACIHEAEAQPGAQNAATGSSLDITAVLNQHGIPTSNARVLVSYSLDSHALKVRIENGGVNWAGTLSLQITKD